MAGFNVCRDVRRCHAAADPGNAQRMRSRTPRRYIRVQCIIGPFRISVHRFEKIGERAFLKLFNEDDVGVILDSRVSG